MLMDTHNALSTTTGLMTANYQMKPDTMNIVTLRSSDDSMTANVGLTPQHVVACIDREKEPSTSTEKSQQQKDIVL